MVMVLETLPERVCALLRARIVSGQIPPGAAIRQDELAHELGISKIPIREALARLVEEGLVEAFRNRGFSASPLSDSEEREIFSLRARIEPEALALAAQGATSDERALVARLAEAPGAPGPPGAQIRLALRFALIEPCRRALTVGVLKRLVLLGERYGGSDPAATAAHRPLLDAWIAGNGDQVSALATRQLQARAGPPHVQETARALTGR